MLTLLKKYMPEFIKLQLKKMKSRTIDAVGKKMLAKSMAKKHAQLITGLKDKDKVNVVFLVIHESVWKVDAVFQKMLVDPFFEPEILVCPYVVYGEERMLNDMSQAYEFFKSKGYSVRKSLKDDGSWLRLEELKPDIVFFTNPHNLTRPEYYDLAYKKYLSCYVPYFYLVTTHGDDQSIYNQNFHNAMWKIFMPHEYSMSLASKISAIHARNCILTGYPACESLIRDGFTNIAWKKQDHLKKKIIFAPHHTIEGSELRLSNFLILAEHFIYLAEKYKYNLQWSFKPHPILKSKLYLHDDWGKEKTDRYYRFWKDSSNTQLDEGEYTALFLESDAIIHDSGSFIAEYLFVKKPALYLMFSGKEQLIGINGFGISALNSYTFATDENDIDLFISSVLSGTACLNDKHHEFIRKEMVLFYDDVLSSVKITNHVKESIN